jgi:hypothetical protein
MQDPAGGMTEANDQDSTILQTAGRWRWRWSPLTFLFGFGAGAFVGVGLAALAFSIADDSSGKPSASAAVQVDAPLVVASGTPQPTPTALTRTKTALDVRLGPGEGYAVVGLLARGDSVEVIGRDNDSKWLAIRFPPGSAAQGWIPVSGVESPPELSRLAVALPTPLPRTVASFPSSIGSGDDGSGSSAAATRTAGPASGTPTFVPGLPDLVVTRVGLLPDRRVSVTVTNRGPGDLVGFTVFVQVRDLGVRSEVMSAAIPFLRIGQTLTLETSTFQISGEETIQAIVDPFGSVNEADKSNNTMQVVLAAQVTPTSTSTLAPLS